MAGSGAGQRAWVKQHVVDVLLDRTLKGKTYGDRRGAAFGLAGAVQGLSIRALNDFGVMAALREGVESKSDANAREGALFAFEVCWGVDCTDVHINHLLIPLNYNLPTAITTLSRIYNHTHTTTHTKKGPL